MDVDSCPADGCGPSLQHTSVPCLMDDMACLGLVGDAVPKKGVVKPRVSRSTKDMFDRAQAQRDFKDAIEWLDKHQFPCDCSKPKLFPVQHPRGDGDGYATRLGRLATRILPHLLDGEVFVVSGGFRGYTDAEACGDRGLECVYKPTSSCLPDGTLRSDVQCSSDGNSKSARRPPMRLVKHGRAWWFGVLLFYMQRPNQDLVDFIHEKVSPLPYVPMLEPDHGITPPENERDKCYLGVQIRKGDKNEARPFKDKDYKENADLMALELLRNNLLDPLPPPPPGKSEAADTDSAANTSNSDSDSDSDSDSGEADGKPVEESTGAGDERAGADSVKEKLLAFVATDDKKTAKRLRKKSDRAKWDHVQFAMLKSGESRGVGRPGLSVANFLLRKQATDDKQYRMTLEIAADTLMLSNSCGLVGLASSKISLVAAYVGTASGRFVTHPVGVDAGNEYRLRPAKPSSDDQAAASLWNLSLPPFLPICCGPMN